MTSVLGWNLSRSNPTSNLLIGAENHEGLRKLPCMPAVDKGIEDWHFQNL
jgi:hypothetical protein